jgi:hypothetical protein
MVPVNTERGQYFQNHEYSTTRRPSRQIWQIANDVCGLVDGWNFKQYVGLAEKS